MKSDKCTITQLCCGYKQVWDVTRPGYLSDISLSLWMEHGVFHVRAHDFDMHERVFWDSFRTLAKARKRFNIAKAELRKRYAHRKVK